MTDNTFIKIRASVIEMLVKIIKAMSGNIEVPVLYDVDMKPVLIIVYDTVISIISFITLLISPKIGNLIFLQNLFFLSPSYTIPHLRMSCCLRLDRRQGSFLLILLFEISYKFNFNIKIRELFIF